MRLSLIVTGVLFSFSVQSIVNIEKVDIDSKAEPFQGELDFKISGASGNSENFSSSLGSRFQWNDISTQFLVFKYNYAESFDVKSKDSTFVHYRYILNPKKMVTTEYYLQAENNEFKLLNLRTLAGAGYRFRLFEKADLYQGRLGIGVFYSREEINDANNTIDEVNRLNSYFTFLYKIKKGLSFLTTSYYQPDIDQFSDYRLLEQLSLEFNLAKGLLYFVTIDISYDSDPVVGLEKNDTSYKSGIKYRF